MGFGTIFENMESEGAKKTTFEKIIFKLLNEVLSNAYY